MAKTKSFSDKIKMTLQFPRYAGYQDYLLKTPVVVQLKNEGAETEEAEVKISGGKLFVPFETRVQLPFESNVEVTAEEIFSPLFLAQNSELVTDEAQVVVLVDGKEILKQTAQVTALPYDWWEGTDGNAERVAPFVRPRLSDCDKILEDAGNRLKKWNCSSEFYGYAGTDKNAVRKIAAAVYAAVKACNFEKNAQTDLSVPLSACAPSILKEKKANALELAVFVASCLEEAMLHPVIAVGKNAVGVGVWLYDSCFLDTVTDDGEIVEKYISDGINNLSFFDVEDLFLSKSVAFTLSETHFQQKLKEDYYDSFVDIRRCRISRIMALPLRGKGLHGFELIKEKDMSNEAAPLPLREYKDLQLDKKQPKNKQWERRLLDLTAKNTLLHFTGKNALHLICPDGDYLYSALTEKGSLRLKEGEEETTPFGEEAGEEKELIELEQRKGILRVHADIRTLSDTALKLLRRNREADEETGTKILYLAFGFLKYTERDGSVKYAPLVLAPVNIRRDKGNENYLIENTEKEYFVNTTLLEYLKQEFNIDVRGLGDDVSALKISELLAMVLAETASMKGWTVTKDVYLSTFSFQRYLMWNDIRSHFDELKTNATVNALLNNYAGAVKQYRAEEEDEASPEAVLTPLPCDSSQYSAIALSRTGASFVLHGPPGTGKSQTITNIIANALEDNKRVLFVAEKKAALDVVKKRLDWIGIGDFCLELHSNKTDKSDVIKRMERTLSLAETAEEVKPLTDCAGEIVSLRKELKAPMDALHKKRRLGISIYEAILLYLQNKNAPDILDIESSFYDSLTEKKLNECKNMILSAAAKAKECGGVYNSPFENVNLSEYSTQLRDRVYCASEVVVTEIKHLKAYLGLFLEFYRQKISTVTQKKLEDIALVASNLLSGVYDKYYSGVTEEQFYVFFSASRRFDELYAYYSKYFKTLIDFGKDYAEVKNVLDSGRNYRGSKEASAAVKKLARVAIRPMAEEDITKFLQTAVDIHAAIRRIKSVPALSRMYVDRGGNLVLKRRNEFLADLKKLHEICASAFLDFNSDAFNGMCIRAQNGYTTPVLEGYLKAMEALKMAQESFLTVTNADRNKIVQEDVLDYYSTKASALIDNIDMLPNWCVYKETERKLTDLGCHFITEALENGRLTGENILSGFEKNVYKKFLEINVPIDPELSRITAGTVDETVEKFRSEYEEFSRLSIKKIRADLISRLPRPDGEESLNVELSTFRRLSKGNLRGTGLRALFAEVGELTKRVCPCMLMSPVTVAQYIKPEADEFDLVIFDEASQMTTAEAVGSIARAKAAIVVGDPKQLPPTSFFRSAYVDEENLENEDLESILDDCLALGMPERHLKWHYRSKHESLIAFSNAQYYDNLLCTFPSPDSLESKVKLVQVDGVYDRGFTKRNRKEAEALVAEVVRRLSDPILSRSSIGIVTFSSAQQNDIERLLTKAIVAHKLDGAAYDREEPLFVKNLENVQGDERDVILFSVCYGPDGSGKISLNFGPLNQAGGWRRLNVAVSRAREEMVVFTTMTSDMINLAKTSSKGVAGLKAFLEFAEKGKTTLALKSEAVKSGAGIGKFIAKDLLSYGYECRCEVGMSDFKIDVAVIDPKNKQRFILAIVTDAMDNFSVKDRNVLQIQTLKRGNWNVMRVNCVNYFNNPKRELKRIKDVLDKLTGAEKRSDSWITKNAKAYRAVKTTGGEVAAFITSGENDPAIVSRLKEIVTTEEPISRAFLKARCLETFGITKSGARVEARLDGLIDECKFRRDRVMGKDYFYKNDRAIAIGKYRMEGENVLRKKEDDFTPFEMVSFIKSALEERVSLYLDELISLICATFGVKRASEKFVSFIRECVAYGEEKGILVRSISDRISLS